MKPLLLHIIRMLGARALVRWMNGALRRLVRFLHRIQFLIEWGGTPTSNWFDHNIDLYYLWHETRNPSGWERGIFSLLAMKPGAHVLDICCGDGFYSNYFYSIRAGRIVAFDIDREAIRSAQQNCAAPHVQFLVADALTQMPYERFDNIVWDSAIEYFTEDEIRQVMGNIQSRLKSEGVLSGYVVIQEQCNSGQKHVFRSRMDFERFMRPYFSNLRTFETVYPNRYNVYFYAGNGVLPFDEGWDLLGRHNHESRTGLH